MVCETCKKVITENGEIVCAIHGTVLGYQETSGEEDLYGFRRSEEGEGARASGPALNYIYVRRVGTKEPDRGLVPSALVSCLVTAHAAASRLQLPQIAINEAGFQIQKIYREIGFGTTKYEIWAAAAIYIAARLHEIPITLEEVVKTIKDGDKEFLLEVQGAVREYSFKISPLPPFPVGKLIQKVGEKAGLRQETIRLAHKIYTYLKDRHQKLLEGKTPLGLATAVLYLAAYVMEEVSQKQMAERAGVPPNLIKSNIKYMKGILQGLLRKAQGTSFAAGAAA